LNCKVFTPAAAPENIVYFFHGATKGAQRFLEQVAEMWSGEDHLPSNTKLVFLEAPHSGYMWASYQVAGRKPAFTVTGDTDFGAPLLEGRYKQAEYDQSAAKVKDAIGATMGTLTFANVYLFARSQGGWMATEAAFNYATEKVGGLFLLATMPMQPLLNMHKALPGPGKMAIGVWTPGEDSVFGTFAGTSDPASDWHDAVFYKRDKQVLTNFGMVDRVKVACQGWETDHLTHGTSSSPAVFRAFHRMLTWDPATTFEEVTCPGTAPEGIEARISF